MDFINNVVQYSSTERNLASFDAGKQEVKIAEWYRRQKRKNLKNIENITLRNTRRDVRRILNPSSKLPSKSLTSLAPSVGVYFDTTHASNKIFSKLGNRNRGQLQRAIIEWIQTSAANFCAN